MENSIRVVLVDDHIEMHRVVRTVTGRTSDIKLVAQGSTGQDALQLCEQFLPDILLLDVVMPMMDGIEAIKILRDKFPKIKILVLSNFQDHESVHQMIQYGAAGYITKTSLSQDLIGTIRAIHSGQRVFSDGVMAQLLQRPSPQTKYHLTGRELEVLGLMAMGLNVPEMARKLLISQSTVKFHMDNIYGKLKVQTRSEALILAAKNNLV